MSESPWAPERSRRKGAPKSGRIIEIITVVLLALGTLGSAWSAFQVSRWNGVETDEARTSASFRVDASREYALATQTVAYDAAAVSQYAQAISSDNANLQRFIRETIVRPAFLPILDNWEEQIAAGEPDLPGGGRAQPAHHVEQRGLAGAVGPDQREDLATPDIEADLVDRQHAAKAYAQVAG